MDQRTTIKLLDDTFNHDFDLQRFSQFVKELFNKFTFTQKSWSVWQEYQDYIESYQLLGSYHDNSKKTVDVLVVKLKKTTSRDRARTMQRNFIAKYLSNAEKDAALVAFYGDDPQDWRFSFVKMEYQLVKDGEKVKVSKELTPAKRYSFLVGVNEPNHTCRRQFLNLVMEEEVSPSLEEIEKAFSIDNVTKEFFSEYKELFLKLKESLERVLESDKRVKKEFEEKNISSVDFAKKLLGQVVFIYFLQKKGWLGVTKDKSGAFNHWGTGPKNFLRRLFDKDIVHYDNFFNDILEPLFYEALATERDDDYYSRFNCKIPFLNGGLFEPINDYDWAGTAIVLDNAIFENIFSVFDRFNFTVKEDEPLEKEVAVDPEMLGKVFENLLDVTDRKSKGAFYTPREIVHYMCQQSLINYLETNSDILREDIEKFIQLGDLALAQIIKEQEQVKKYGKTYDVNENYSIPTSIKQNHQLVDKLLKEIKVVDPAVGSGAFPVGMMNEIVKARSILSIYFKEARNDYDLKRETIENCLYGVDIESSAVDIAKLRFWLTLIVDELDMKNIKPLPNLDHKIMCGNSLLEEFEGKKLFDEKLLGEVKKDYSFEFKQIDSQIAELNKEKGEIARGKSNGKSIKEIEKHVKLLEGKKQKLLFGKEKAKDTTLEESISKRIKESQKKLSELKELQRKFFNEQNRKLKRQYRDEIDRLEWELVEETLKEEGNASAIEKLKEYKKNKSKPFFLWKLYFAEVFQRENPGFDVVIANPPYVNIFNIKDDNYRNYLMENYTVAKNKTDLYAFFVEKGVSLLRKNGDLAFIMSNSWLGTDSFSKFREFLVDQTKVRQLIKCPPGVFEEATVTVIVLLLKKEKISNTKIELLELKDYKFKKINYGLDYNFIRDQASYGFTFDKQIKIHIDTVKLGELATFSLGIKTSDDKRFVMGSKKDVDSYKMLRGKDVSRYVSRFNNKWMWYKPQLMNQKNGAGPRKLEFFLQPKILIKDVAIQIEANLDDKNYLTTDTLTILYEIKSYELKFILALLNSRLINCWFKMNFPAGLHIKINQLKNIPLPQKNNLNQKPFIHLVDQILSLTKDSDYLDNPDKKAKVKRLEKEIDQLVYKLYELTPEEIKIVEEFGK